MLLKTQFIATANQFADYPEQIISTTARSVNISVAGSGAIKGTTGRRWWDSNVLTSDGTISLTPNVPVALPFTKAFLSSSPTDLICRVTIDGESRFYAASSSADNVVITSPASEDSILCYCELYAFGTANALGDPVNGVGNFLQGGQPRQLASNGSNAVFNFCEPTESAGNLDIEIGYNSYSAGARPNKFNATYAFVAGVLSVNIAPPPAIASAFSPSPNSDPGFFTVKATITGTTGRPYLQLLNRYHWGCSS